MFADAGTKAMDVEHLQDTLRRGTWSITYSPSFIKQVAKGKRTPAQAPVAASADLPGEPLDGRDPMLGFLMKFAEMKGWHNHQNMGINVAHSAKSYRTPEPRTRAEVRGTTVYASDSLPLGDIEGISASPTSVMSARKHRRCFR